MTQVRQDFEATARTAKILTFAVTEDGEPVDLTGLDLRWRCAASPDGDALLEKTSAVDGGIDVTEPLEGGCTVTIEDGDIEDGGLYYHFLEADMDAGWTCIARGRLVVGPSLGPVGA